MLKEEIKMNCSRSVSSLANKYDAIIELSDKAYIVQKNKKFGIVYTDDRIAVPVTNTEFTISDDIVILTDCINGTTSIFSKTCNKYVNMPEMYRIQTITDGIVVLREIRTSNGRTKMAIYSIADMQEILEPSAVQFIQFNPNSDYIAVLELFNSGYKLDNVLYAINHNFEMKVIGKNEIDF